jgi:hypothetical protein
MIKFMKIVPQLFLYCFLIQFNLYAQTGTGNITGQITDENGQPQVGATIYIEEYTLGTTADANGNFQLLGVPAGEADS